MCELLGMTANVPTDICFSFSGLMQRGGITGPHRDGWGVTFYEGKGCRSFHDPEPSADSEIAKLVTQYPIKSQTVICHIRQANSGGVSLENTHPFTRELWGQNWTFAHNGQLKDVEKEELEFYFPIGTTDSEYAFCWILDQTRKQFPKKPKNQKILQDFIHTLCTHLNSLGIFNMLLSDSVYLYSFCSTKLCWITRKAPFGKASLIDTEVTINFKEETTPQDIVTVIATQQLTDDETWQKMEEGEFHTFQNGLIYS
ncbi:MAG: putative glutamine amidotransferase [bacterium]|jgi:predicted glutamine amidotransferase